MQSQNYTSYFVVVEIAGVLKRRNCTNNWGGPHARLPQLPADYVRRSISLRPAKGPPKRPKTLATLRRLMGGKIASPKKEAEIHFCSVLRASDVFCRLLTLPSLYYRSYNHPSSHSYALKPHYIRSFYRPISSWSKIQYLTTRLPP